MKIALITCLLLMGLCSTLMAAGHTVVKEAEVRQVITDFLKQKSDNLGLDITIRKIGYSGSMTLPQGAVTYDIIAPDRWEGWGSANLALIVRVDDRVERNLTVKVEVEALADMVVSVRPLERGEIIGPEDVAIQKRALSRTQGKILSRMEEVLGKRIRTAIRGNNPIRSDYLERVPLVKSGQLVTIVAENDSIRITAAGKVRSSGAEGDRVMVQNLASQKEVAASVVDAATVRVDF